MQTKKLIKKLIKAIIPYGILVLYRRRTQNYCPICKKYSSFISYGFKQRPKAQCPHCGSLERHRLLWMFFRKINLFNYKKAHILHFAAETCFETHFKKSFENYLTADLYDKNAMQQIDITNIPYLDNSFDFIICNHVLEHIVDDIRAMREIFRVLKKKQMGAILLVPIANIDKTYEDFSINTELGRAEAFGQPDHVRKYGKDYIDRLRSVGFNVALIKGRYAKDIGNEFV